MVVKVGNVISQVKSRYSSDRFFGLTCKLIMILMGAILPLWAFVDAFEIQFNLVTVVLAAAAGVIIFSFIVGGRKTKGLLLAGISVLFVIYIIVYGSELKEAILNIANAVINEYNAYFSKKVEMFTVEGKHVIRNNTMLLGAVAFEFTFILVTSSWYKVYKWVHYLVTAIFVIPVFMLGHMPNIWLTVTIAAYLIMVGMAGRGTVRKRKDLRIANPHRINDCINGKAYIYMGVIILAVSAITVTVVNPKSYNRDESLNGAKSYLEKQVKKINKLDFLKFWNNGSVASGGMSGGILGLNDSLEYDNESVMKITVPADSAVLYIKGFVGAKYENNRWYGCEGGFNELYEDYGLVGEHMISVTERGLRDLLYTDGEFGELYQSIMEDTVTIELTGADREYFYTPYFADLSMYTQEFDYKIVEDMPDEVQFNVFDIPISEDYDSLMNLIDISDRYTTFVNRAYQNSWSFEVSSEVDDIINTYYGTAELPMFAPDIGNYQECVTAVQNYLNENMEYSLKPGKVPDGEDFLDRFLITNKKGYCSHFATAATMMFRAEGIPARYVEGYAISSEQYKKNLIKKINIEQRVGLNGEKKNKEYYELDIKDTCAHAWVEIYINGFGWVPVEVTPGYNNAIQGEMKKNDQKETTTQRQTTSSVTTTQNKTTTKSGTAVKQKESDIDFSTAVKVVCILGIILMATAAVILVEKNRMKTRYGQLHSRNIRKNILVAGEYLDKLCKLEKLGLPEQLSEREKAEKIAEHFSVDPEKTFAMYHMLERAYFDSRGATFSKEEGNVVVSVMYNVALSGYQSGNVYKKIIIRYVWCILEK